MGPNSAENPRRRRRWRRWLAFAVALLIMVGLLGAAALPWWLGSESGRTWLLGRANATLAPARLEVRAFAFSWFGPTRMEGFTLIDHQGERVVSAHNALWDRNLWQILFDRPRYGTLDLGNARLDVEHFKDGTVDLYEALRPVLTGNRRTSFRIRVQGGSLALRSPRLHEPVTGKRMELLVIRPAAPEPIRWDLKLQEPAGPASNEAWLACSGRFERWRPDADGTHPVEITLETTTWPLSVEGAGLVVEGTFGGRILVGRDEGQWLSTGQIELDGARLSGPAMAADTVDAGTTTAAWALARSGDGLGPALAWLDLDSPLATLHTKGQFPATEGRSSRMEGRVDLAAIARQAPHALRLREDLTLDKGLARLVVENHRAAGRSLWDVSAELGELEATHRGRTLRLDAPLTLSAHLVGEPDSLAVERLAIDSEFLKAEGAGDVDRGIDVTGTLDLASLQDQAREILNLGETPLAGRGQLAATYQRDGSTYRGSLALDIDDLAIGGSIRAESVRVETSVRGEADASGLPTDWQVARLVFRSAETSGSAVAMAGAGGASLVSAWVERPVTISVTDGLASARVVAIRERNAWAINEAVATLAPLDARQGATVAVGASGRLDPESGTLDLRPDPSTTTGGALALGPEGVHVVGLDGPEWRARGRLVGDIGDLTRLLASWSGRPASDVSGSWSARVEAGGGSGEAVDFAGRLDLPDLSWPGEDGPRGPGPIGLDLAGSYREASEELAITELSIGSDWGSLVADGRVGDLQGRPFADLQGELRPDWDALTERLRGGVEPNARLAGRPRAFRFRGPLAIDSDDPLAGVVAELGFEIDELDVYGMRLGATPVVARVEGGAVGFEPIVTTLNGGSLHLAPELARDEAGGWTLRLASGSVLEGAQVNDEVSHRVLAYVAPVLDRATSVNGRVSADLTRAEVPIGPGASQKAVVEGRVVFDDVAFTPGPLAEVVMGLIGREAQTLRLDEPVLLTVADGRVHQRGLAVPVGNLTEVQLDGSVGFDRSLDLVAGVPITRQMVLNNPVLGDVVEGTRIAVPIGGTLADPKVDREAFQTAMRDLGKDLLSRGAVRGAAELIFRLSQPRDPSQPRLTPRERRQLRREQRQRIP